MTSKRKSTLDQIAALLQPAPEAGSDDDLDFDTKAKVIDYEEEFSEEDRPRRPILKQSAALDDDPRYTGKKISRRAAVVAEDSGNESSVTSGSEHLLKDEISDSEKDVKSSGIEAGNEEIDEDDNESDEYDDSEDYESEGSYESGDGVQKGRTRGAESGEEEEEPDSSFQHISSTKSVESEVEKGNAVKSQVNIWDTLLECRIHLQKCLIPANRLPKHHKLDAFKQDGGLEFASEVKKTEKGVRILLDKLVTLQRTLVNNYSETKNLGKKDHKEKIGSDDEIPSDNDQEDDRDEVSEVKPPKIKRRRIDDIEELLSEDHKQYIEFRDATIQKWNDRTRIVTGKASSRDFSAFEQSTLQQIRHVLSNRTRLVNRTRVPRTVGPILGEPEPTEDNTQPEHDPEIFDDSDFYHQLLRELIERRTDDTQDAATLGRRWAALHKLRTKMKRRVDTRATKGRRLRYDPHQKLVGFMAPVVSSNVWNDKSVSELFNSLFGKRV